jgi:PhzF family phenazine biosynthesis protein
MAELRFKQVDVFTDRPLFGNPVAVIIGAEGLDTQTMQRIARWTNLSEATFLLKSDKADYRLRIFSPTQELPFAGHPTIGSAHAALESGFVPRKPRLIQECGAGLLELTVEDGAIFVKGPQPKVSEVSAAEVSRAVGAQVGQLKRIDVGPVWLVGEVASTAVLAGLEPDMAALALASNELKATGATLFAAAKGETAALHVRSFAPAHNIPEDPVCGSGNLSVGFYVGERFGARYVARQGMQLGRNGLVTVLVERNAVWIGGRSVTCVEGSLRL